MSQQGQEIYVGIRFLSKSDKVLNNSINFSLNVNGSTYRLCNEIVLEYETLTTTKASTTKKETTEKQSTESKNSADKNESSTKFKYSGAGSATTWKFSYSGEHYYEGNEIYGDGQAQMIQGENAEGSAVQGNSSDLSQTAKLLYAAAIVLAVSGTVVILYNAMKYKEEQRETQKENGED